MRRTWRVGFLALGSVLTGLFGFGSQSQAQPKPLRVQQEQDRFPEGRRDDDEELYAEDAETIGELESGSSRLSPNANPSAPSVLPLDPAGPFASDGLLGAPWGGDPLSSRFGDDAVLVFADEEHVIPLIEAVLASEPEAPVDDPNGPWFPEVVDLATLLAGAVLVELIASWTGSALDGQRRRLLRWFVSRLGGRVDEGEVTGSGQAAAAGSSIATDEQVSRAVMDEVSLHMIGVGGDLELSVVDPGDPAVRRKAIEKITDRVRQDGDLLDGRTPEEIAAGFYRLFPTQLAVLGAQ